MKDFKTVAELSIEARAWQCSCGEICQPSSGAWRWNGNEWEHSHGYPIGHCIAERKAKRTAHDTGDGWWIGEENLDGDIIKEEGIDWPSDWPETVSASFLIERGYEIV